jgi:hypothetical protein
MPSPVPATPLSPQQHLTLWSMRSALSLILHASDRLGPLEELVERYPALLLHINAAARAGLEGLLLPQALARLDQQLLQAPDELPLNRLRSALQLDAEGLSGFLLCAWIDDEPELVPLFDALGAFEGRCTRAMLSICTGMDSGINALLEGGYLSETLQNRRRVLEMPAAIGAALQGQAVSPWRVTPQAALPGWDQLILPAPLLQAAQRPSTERVCWALRGGPGSGRQTLAGAIARAAGLGLIQGAPDDALLPALATLFGAMPLLQLEPTPGQRLALPEWPGFRTPMAASLPRFGGLGSDTRQLRWLELLAPDPHERAGHWRLALQGKDSNAANAPTPATQATRTTEAIAALVDLRLPRGSIHRLVASLPPEDIYKPAAVMAELEAQGRYLLDGSTRRVPPASAQEPLALSEELQEEFDALLARCRHRETLHTLMPGAFGHGGGSGVRALFKGPSGTGKTLAARHLASALFRPLYRVDLASTVSKYIGETERNLERVFEAAEALDIVLLLDEGDALMAGRTGVNNANDRYANLETNYLLQRLETFEGVLVVTTNAAERIDTAFARRMDVTLDFALPDALMRHGLWQAHLPLGHTVGDATLDEIARRCPLSGGQIRNAALHAALLGLQHAGTTTTSPCTGSAQVLAALQREYRRAGQHCPSLTALD